MVRDEGGEVLAGRGVEVGDRGVEEEGVEGTESLLGWELTGLAKG